MPHVNSDSFEGPIVTHQIPDFDEPRLNVDVYKIFSLEDIIKSQNRLFYKKCYK